MKILKNIIILINTLLVSVAILFADWSMFIIAIETTMVPFYWFRGEKVEERYTDFDDKYVEKEVEFYAEINNVQVRVNVDETFPEYDGQFRISLYARSTEKDVIVRINSVKIIDRFDSKCLLEKNGLDVVYSPEFEVTDDETGELEYVGTVNIGIFEPENYKHEYGSKLTFELNVDVESNGTTENKTVIYHTFTDGYRYSPAMDIIFGAP